MVEMVEIVEIVWIVGGFDGLECFIRPNEIRFLDTTYISWDKFKSLRRRLCQNLKICMNLDCLTKFDELVPQGY
jgi:hypothetical protein